MLSDTFLHITAQVSDHREPLFRQKSKKKYFFLDISGNNLIGKQGKS
jgi:hypothetical protein